MGKRRKIAAKSKQPHVASLAHWKSATDDDDINNAPGDKSPTQAAELFLSTKRTRWDMRFASAKLEKRFVEYTFSHTTTSLWLVGLYCLMAALGNGLLPFTAFEKPLLSGEMPYSGDAPWQQDGAEGARYICYADAFIASVGGFGCIALAVAKLKLPSRTVEYTWLFCTFIQQFMHLTSEWRYRDFCVVGHHSSLMRDPDVPTRCDDFIEPFLIVTLLTSFVFPARLKMQLLILYGILPIPFMWRFYVDYLDDKPLFRASDGVWITIDLLLIAPMVAHEYTMRAAFKQDIEVSRDRWLITESRNAVKHLLSAMLPSTILRRVVKGQHLAPTSGGNLIPCDTAVATLIFSDVVQFTDLCAKTSSNSIVAMLSQMSFLFDQGVSEFGVEKIKTIGDSYLAVCGLPDPSDHHVLRACAFAKHMVNSTKRIGRVGAAKKQIQVRVGVHTGVVSGGIFGSHQALYDVFGRSVEVVETIEEVAPVGCVLVSQKVKEHLQALTSTPSFTLSISTPTPPQPTPAETKLVRNPLVPEPLDIRSTLLEGICDDDDDGDDMVHLAGSGSEKGAICRLELHSQDVETSDGVLQTFLLKTFSWHPNDLIHTSEHESMKDNTSDDGTTAVVTTKARVVQSQISPKASPTTASHEVPSLQNTTAVQIDSTSSATSATGGTGSSSELASNATSSTDTNANSRELHLEELDDETKWAIVESGKYIPNHQSQESNPLSVRQERNLPDAIARQIDNDEKKASSIPKVAETRETLSVSSSRFLLTFDRPEVESGFRNWLAKQFSRKLAAASGMLLAAQMVIYVALLGEGHFHEWYTHVPLSLLIIGCACQTAYAIHATRRDITLNIIVWFLIFHLECVGLYFTLFCANRSLMNIDLLYVTFIFMVISPSLGPTGYVLFQAQAVFHFVFLLLPHLVAQIMVKTIFSFYQVAIFLAVMIWGIGLYRAEKVARRQSINSWMATIAKKEIEDEHDRVASLLNRMMPSFIVKELTSWYCGPRSDAFVLNTTLPMLGIMFCSIDNLRAQFFSSTSPDVMALAAGYSALCDRLVEGIPTDCTKMKMIGDVAMIVSGLQEGCEDVLVKKLASSTKQEPSSRPRRPSQIFTPVGHHRGARGFSSVVPEELTPLPIIEHCPPHLPTLVALAIKLQREARDVFSSSVTCGLHCGRCTAGVVGSDRLSYDVFGDTVNTASRIRSASSSSGVWISEFVKQNLLKCDKSSFEFEDATLCGIKGIKSISVCRVKAI